MYNDSLKQSIAALIVVFFVLAIVSRYQTAYSQSPSQKILTINISAGSGSKAGSVPMPFSPNILFIHRDDTVMWNNQDIANHSVLALGFNSGTIWPQGSSHGSSIYNHTFDKQVHSSMLTGCIRYMGGVIYVDVPVSQSRIGFYYR